ncbi:Sodium-dependent phosphate transport protein [Acididesulfobacillus acetoxydans]|uniref:Na+/Pi-cotransporter protein n=1 Tax=Acididesulfobacillus acetoxydans TaxID=1561005 RepID=A0A8S0Y1N0_9FIRM|nr:Na/Pi cotransporter family protein [Acididesulfobacillus acetoxydans]CAA7599685.1 Sodium-dependent phosphate transport protein [Acididesulfobacillus acetoxydans]CEJ06237.1 Na+/Pi-cotransporter protein [Acididesulfobacillus acetoxydans]
MTFIGPLLMFLGGLGLFMYGVQTTSDGLQKFAAGRMKKILGFMTKHTYLEVFFGIAATVAFQSSTATTVLVVEFVNAGMMNLAQALGMVLSSAVGTSVALQLLAFKILNIALALIFIGVVLQLTGKRWRHLGQALIGFGVIYVGMANMSAASAPLLGFPQVSNLLVQLAAYPLLAMLVALVLNVLIQGSAAVLAIMMSMAAHHLLPFAAVVPLVLGAHAGGTILTLLSGLTTQKMDAKRVAVANTAYKIVGIIIVFPFLPQFDRLVQWTTTDVQRQVANAYLIFALFMLVVFLPFNGWIAKALVRFLPGRNRGVPSREFAFIDEASLELPAVAIKQSLQEVAGLGERIREKMLDKLPQAFLAGNDEPANHIGRFEIDVDWYYRHITRFLTTVSQKGLADEQTEQIVNAQIIVKEFEYLGDTLMALVQQIHKIHREGIDLKQRDWESIAPLYAKVAANFARLLEALRAWDEDKAGAVIREHPDILRLQRSIQFSALAGLPAPGPETVGAKELEKLRYFLVDAVNLFYNVDEHVVNIAQVIMGIA